MSGVQPDMSYDRMPIGRIYHLTDCLLAEGQMTENHLCELDLTDNCSSEFKMTENHSIDDGLAESCMAEYAISPFSHFLNMALGLISTAQMSIGLMSNDQKNHFFDFQMVEKPFV